MSLADDLVVAAYNVAPDGVTTYDAAEMVASALRELGSQGYRGAKGSFSVDWADFGQLADEIEAGV